MPRCFFVTSWFCAMQWLGHEKTTYGSPQSYPNQKRKTYLLVNLLKTFSHRDMLTEINRPSHQISRAYNLCHFSQWFFWFLVLKLDLFQTWKKQCNSRGMFRSPNMSCNFRSIAGLAHDKQEAIPCRTFWMWRSVASPRGEVVKLFQRNTEKNMTCFEVKARASYSLLLVGKKTRFSRHLPKRCGS